MKLPSASCVVIALSLAFPAYGQISVQSGDDLVSGYLSKGQYDLNLLGGCFLEYGVYICFDEHESPEDQRERSQDHVRAGDGGLFLIQPQ